EVGVGGVAADESGRQLGDGTLSGHDARGDRTGPAPVDVVARRLGRGRRLARARDRRRPGADRPARAAAHAAPTCTRAADGVLARTLERRSEGEARMGAGPLGAAVAE